MTDAELADLKKRATAMMDGGDAFFADELFTAAIDGKTRFSSSDTQVGNYDQTWLSERVWDNRTSLIIDPPDGRIPAPAPGAAERARAQITARQGRGPADAPEDLSLGTRCISYGTPNIRAGYQSYFEITQGPDVLALRAEMIHDVRIFSTGKSSHVSSAIRQYHGDSTARWDGDTLVVDTTNYNGKTSFSRTVPFHSDALHTTERFTRVDANLIDYRITIDDPQLFTKPITIAGSFQAADPKTELMEFACAEGSQVLANVFGFELAPGRAQGSR
jgi:hypothetical protein